MKSNSEKKTKQIAAEFIKTLSGGDVVFLEGELGSGKTTFVRGVAESLGFDKPVRSPTFTIVNRYPVEHESIKEIIHVDLYRIEDASELGPLALEETIGQPKTISFIEWPRDDLSIAPTHTISFVVGEEYTIDIK